MRSFLFTQKISNGIIRNLDHHHHHKLDMILMGKKITNFYLNEFFHKKKKFKKTRFEKEEN